MKDYSYLKGKGIKFVSSFGHKFENCVLVEIGQAGLTVMGTLITWKDGHTDDEIGTEVKIYCIRTEEPQSAMLMPYVVSAIKKGVLNPVKIKQALGLASKRGVSEPVCAFE